MKRVVCFGASNSYLSDVLIGAVFQSPQYCDTIEVVGCVDTARLKRDYKMSTKRYLYNLKLKLSGDSQACFLSCLPNFLKVASSAGVPIIKANEGEGINSRLVLNMLSGMNPDYLLVMGCPQILKRPLLDIPNIASINYHYSCLPKYAGCNAPFWALLYGEKETANTFHIIEETIDIGAIVIQDTVPICADDTVRKVGYRLVMSAKDSIATLLDQMATGELQRIPQNNNDRSYRSAKDYDLIGQICWDLPARAIERICRIYGRLSAYLPSGEQLLASRISIEPFCGEFQDKPVGTVLQVEKDRLLCRCSDGQIWFWKKKILGLLRNPLGHKIKVGDRLSGRDYSEKLDNHLLKFLAEI